MGTIVVRANLRILIGGLYFVATFFLIVFAWVIDPTGILAALIVAITWAITIGVLAWRWGTLPRKLDRPYRGDPMPGPLGLFRTQLSEAESARPEITTVREAPPTCPKCGTQSVLGELNCSKCRTPLWNQTPTPAQVVG